MNKTYDHIIVGTGQATGTLLGKLIPTGDSITVIEGHKIGGSCVNYGCTPTKAMVASAKAVHQARRGEEFGFDADVVVDFPRIKARMNEIRGESNKGLTEWIESAENVRLIRGWASFEGNKTIRIGEERITGNHIYINTGTRAVSPPIEGLENVPWLDNARLLDLDVLPDHLIIVGGGYIGVEFAQVFRRFGSEVSIIQHGSVLMPREDEEVSLAIQEFLQAEGIQIHCDAAAKSVSNQNGNVELVVEQNGIEKSLKGSHLLIATGRKPNSDKLNLESTDVQVNKRGYIQVDDHGQTAVEGVFALGDVNGHGAFTHTSVNDAEIVLDYLFGGQRKISSRVPIYALFTDPPLGRVGMTEKEATDKGYKILTANKPMAEISRAKEMGETTGFVKVVVDAKTDQLLGASILGVGGDEVIGMFATMIHGKIPCKRFREIVLIHPTISELMPWVFDALEPTD